MVGMSVLLGRELVKKYQIDKEIKQLEREITALESKNKEINELIDYLKSAEYRERQARSLLNLQKPGEFAVALPNPEGQDQENVKLKESKDSRSNLEKWWEYFFGK